MYEPNLVHLRLGLTQLPLVSLHISLELVVMVLKAADKVSHFSVYWA